MSWTDFRQTETSSHSSDSTFEGAKARLLALPPYSPDFNLTETAFSTN